MEEDLCSVLALISAFRFSVMRTSRKIKFYLFCCLVPKKQRAEYSSNK